MLPATCPPRCLGGAVRIFYKTQQRGQLAASEWPGARGGGRGGGRHGDKGTFSAFPRSSPSWKTAACNSGNPRKTEVRAGGQRLGCWPGEGGVGVGKQFVNKEPLTLCYCGNQRPPETPPDAGAAAWVWLAPSWGQRKSEAGASVTPLDPPHPLNWTSFSWACVLEGGPGKMYICPRGYRHPLK